MGGVGLLVVQELFCSPLSDRAHVVVPASAFSEKEGCFVNYAGLAQAMHAGCIPLQGLRTDGQFFLELQQRKGLAHAANLRREIARSVAAFKPLEVGDLGDHGVFLEKLQG